MILDTPEVTVTSTMATKNARKMAIDPESLQYIISSLTDIYQDGVLACIREYSANARDSHETAGQKRPIEVTLPSAFNPTFKVKDYGVGLNYDDLYKYCGLYGASTKRKDKNTIGAFGLGFKCALTLVPQFSIVSIKDGLKHFATVTRGEDTVGVLDVISSVATDEDNGFEVSIPAGKASEFLARADEFFMTWKPGTVLVNGKEPKSFHSEDFEKVGELGYISNARNASARNGGLTVVMGGIGYKVSLSWDLRREFFGEQERKFGYSTILLNVPLGDVELVPNREALKLTDKTKNAVKNYLATFMDTFSKQAIEKITNASTRMEALRNIENFSFFVNRSETKWNGETIPSQVSTASTLYSYSSGRRSKYSTTKPAITISTMVKKDSNIFVETGAAAGDNSLALRHIASYAKAKAFSLSKVFMGTLGAEVDPWIQEMINAGFVHVVKVDDMVQTAKAYNKENRTVRAASTTPRETLTYPVATAKDGGVSIDAMTVATLETLTGPVYYIEQDRGSNRVSGKMFDDYTRDITAKAIFRNLEEGSSVILVTSNRKVSSLETRLKVVKISDALPKLETSVTKKLKRDFSAVHRLTHFLRSMGSSVAISTFKKLAESDVTDPVFKMLGSALNEPDLELKQAIEDVRCLFGWSSSTLNNLATKSTELSGSDYYEKLVAHFPLMRIYLQTSYANYSDSEKTAFIEHFNAVHEAKGAFSL